jgi:hypothetical protein
MELLAKKAEDRPESAKVVAEALREIEEQTARGARRGRSAKKRKPDRGQLTRAPKPRGSRIKERSTPEGTTFKWPLPGSGIWVFLPHVFSVSLLGYSAYQSVKLFWLVPGAVSLSSVLLSLVLPLIVLVSMLRFFRPSRPESITLGTDYFQHDLGRPGGFMASADTFRNQGVDNRPWWRQLLGLPLLVEMWKDELGEIVLERAGGQLRLRYDVGADRIEIGRYLREPEKEWLAEVVREWQKSV